tara:strand:+ start:2443 stop:2862 length:420 start_codon:yes stop_codon:yes gene_type:complete
MKYLLIILALLVPSCANKTSQPKDNSSLVVTYYGKEVHRRNTGWISLIELNRVVEKPGKKFFIFGAPWCEPCNFLRRAIAQANLDHEIHWINIEEEWGRELMVVMGQNTIPYMAAVNEKGEFIATRVGPSQITMFLLLN